MEKTTESARKAERARIVRAACSFRRSDEIDITAAALPKMRRLYPFDVYLRKDNRR